MQDAIAIFVVAKPLALYIYFYKNTYLFLSYLEKMIINYSKKIGAGGGGRGTVPSLKNVVATPLQKL